MSREQWTVIQSSKWFYINTYRKIATILLCSMVMNLVLGFFIYHVYINEPESAMYATSGVMPPVKLTPMDMPNMTSVPLLATNIAEDEPVKVIPY